MIGSGGSTSFMTEAESGSTGCFEVEMNVENGVLVLGPAMQRKSLVWRCMGCRLRSTRGCTVRCCGQQLHAPWGAHSPWPDVGISRKLLQDQMLVQCMHGQLIMVVRWQVGFGTVPGTVRPWKRGIGHVYFLSLIHI